MIGLEKMVSVIHLASVTREVKSTCIEKSLQKVKIIKLTTIVKIK
jgi:hypothetical protein